MSIGVINVSHLSWNFNGGGLGQRKLKGVIEEA